MKKIIKIIILICIILLTLFILLKNFHKLRNKVYNNVNTSRETVEEIKNETGANTETVEKIKNETGASAETELYSIVREYDGREVLEIKPDIQFKTVLAGILKNAKPTIDEADNVNLNNFQKNGIWISKNSREKFIDILKKCNINNFKIDEEGYLSIVDIPKNEYDKELEELTKQNQLIIIDINGICYIRDEMTGKIIDYPFKDMDPMQVCEKFETTNCKIIEITINEINPISILEEILKLK